MRGSRDMDKHRTRANPQVRSNVSSEYIKLSQDKEQPSDTSPTHFDSGAISDLDIRFESTGSIEDVPEGEDFEIKRSLSQSWADSGVQLDSGLDLESITSDLNIQSPLQCAEKDFSEVLVPSSLEHKSMSEMCRPIYQDNDGDSPLHLAVVHRDPHLVFKILALYPEYLNVTNHLSQTALHLAVLLDAVRIVRRLVVCGSHLQLCDYRGDTALHLACRLGHLESLKALTIPVIPKELREAGLEEDTFPQIMARQIPLLFRQRNYEGLTCTHLAVASSHKVLEYILQCGADINAMEGKSGKTVLHLGVERGHPDLIRFLVTVCKADVNVRNYAKHTPLHVVNQQRRYWVGSSNRTRAEAIIRLLRENGADMQDLLADSDQESEDEDSGEE